MDTDLVGSIAGICTTAAFVPQAVKVWRSRSTRDISLGMFVVFTSGVALWLVYGILLGRIPIIATNGLTLVLAVSILIAKLKYG